jgi:Uma2 family endonuclease
MIRPTNVQKRNTYPTSDGKPMAETDLHRDLMLDLIETLKWWFRDEPTTYVSGNLLVFYDRGNKRIHVSPDVFVVPGVGMRQRENYLTWEEGRGLDVVIELTSRTTMIEDTETKYNLYLEPLGTKEYFLFDPRAEYLTPSFQGYRRWRNKFVPIKPTEGRLASKVLGLHLERDGTQMRLWDPATGERLPTPGELARAAEDRADAEADRADRLQRELDELRRKHGQ